jgi:hypothetical protein
MHEIVRVSLNTVAEIAGLASIENNATFPHQGVVEHNLSS